MKKIIVYGLQNCDVTKKALAWLKRNNIDFDFHDYNKLGISPDLLKSWSAQRGWELLLNKRGTTWRSLSINIQQKVTDSKAAIELMKQHTSLIKRPIVASNGHLIIGYDEQLYNDVLLKG